MRGPMTPDVRVPSERDGEQIARLISISINSPFERISARVPTWPLGDLRVVYDGDRVIAVAGEMHFLQWFGGRPLPMSGIFGVATLPEHRRSGLASAVVRSLLDAARERGDPVSALYPAVLRPYRRLGYELAGTFTKHRLPLDAIPSGSATELPPVRLLELDHDLEELKACYHEWARGHTGTIEPDDVMWTTRLLSRPGDDTFRAVVVSGGRGIEGFAAFVRQPAPGPLEVAFGLACNPLVATTGPALGSLLRYFRDHRGVGRWLEWAGPPNDPASLVVQEQSIEQSYRYGWMLRLLDVPAALEQRGYPSEDGTCTIAVEDSLFPENAGPWKVEAERGKVAVRREEGGGRRAVPIGALSAMFSGYLRPADAVRLGYLDADDPSVELLTRLFAGPDPWCPFFF
jgi:predicted acetyltransferase